MVCTYVGPRVSVYVVYVCYGCSCVMYCIVAVLCMYLIVWMDVALCLYVCYVRLLRYA